MLHIHFMGIGGQGISAVAQMTLDARGEAVSVSGCDMQASVTTDLLAQRGIPVQIGHSPTHLVGIDELVVVPAALVLNPDHPELATARAQGIPVNTWQAMLGGLMRGKCLLSVSGVHGKGTTTALLSLMLLDAGLDPTCEVGAIVPRFDANYRLGKSVYFVNEADEYYNNFWHYHPRLAIVTSIEFEHPEFFADYAAYLAAFEHFVRGMDMDGDWPLPPTLIINADSPGCWELLSRLADWPGQCIAYTVAQPGIFKKEAGAASSTRESLAFTGNACMQQGSGTTWHEQPRERVQTLFEAHDVQLEGETSFRVRTFGNASFPEERLIRLQLPGAHNVQNALAALAAASVLGIEPQIIVGTLEGFGGIRRRFEVHTHGPLLLNGQTLDLVVVDDYAHHPTAVATTLAAARSRFPGRRLVAVYQPHMFSRTHTFFAQFLRAFDQADLAIIADIFPARERDTGQISARDLVEAIAQQSHFLPGRAQVRYGGSVQHTTQLVANELRSGDLLLVMGAGDIYRLTEQLLAGAGGAGGY